MSSPGSRAQELYSGHNLAVVGIANYERIEAGLDDYRSSKGQYAGHEVYVGLPERNPDLLGIADEVARVIGRSWGAAIIRDGLDNHVEAIRTRALYAYQQNLNVAATDYQEHQDAYHAAAIAEAATQGVDIAFSGYVAEEVIVLPLNEVTSNR